MHVDGHELKLNFNELSVELTHRCTLDCKYCSSNAAIAKDEFIDLGRLSEIVLEAREKFGVTTISLSGGEAFLYPQFLDLYTFLAKQQFRILIYSSGITLNKYGRRGPIPLSYLRRLAVGQDNPRLFLNIPGHDRKLVEEINGVLGSHALIEKSIENILSAGLYLGAHVVPFKANYRYLKEIVDYCSGKYFNEVRFLRFVPQGRGTDSNLLNTRTEFAEIDEGLRAILKKAQERNSKTKISLGHPINFLFLTGSENLYEEETHCCRGGVDAPLILPNGDVSMCPAWKDLNEFSAGNIYREDFERIWSSSYFDIFRDFVRQGYRKINEPCRSCQHLDGCRGKCVAQRLLAARQISQNAPLEDSLLFSPDPQCFKQLVGS